eukprot:Em0005g634a
MASNGTPGSRLGPHRSRPSASVDLPEIGTRVSVRGANLRLKDSLMRTFGATWKQARIEGVVVEKPKKNCRRVKWTIGSETCVSDHSVAFWKKLSQQQVVTPPATSPDIAAFPDGLTGEEEEPDEHQRERTLLEDELMNWICKQMGGIQTWTNGSLPSTLDHFTEYEHWQCVGVLLGTSLAYGCNIRELWGTKDDGFCPPFNLGSRFNLARDRYLSWKRYLKLWPPDHSDNPWYMAHSLIHAFNQRRREVVEPGTECTIDESMGMWKPFFENTPEGIPSLRKIARKPQGIGIEYKNLADAETGIILHLEIQEAADIMAKKAYCDRYPKSVALVLRLTEMLHGSGRVIHGDSAFASVACCTALLEHGLYFSGLLKTAHKEFPKKYCQDIAFQAGAQRGDTVTICTTKAIGSATKFIYGHVWNEPESEENLVIACLTNTRPGAPAATKHIMELRKRRRQDDEEDTVYQNDVQQIEHEAMPITKYFETRRIKDRLTMQKKQKMSKHGTAVRCKVCPKPAPNANYCCSQCSDENRGNIFGLCGPKSGRVCIPIHQKSMWSSP